MSRAFTPNRKNGTSTTIHVKRACNGCGELIGDVTDEEMDRAIAGLPMLDVRDECPTCTPDFLPLNKVQG